MTRWLEPAHGDQRGLGGLSDRVAVGRLLDAVPPALVREVIAEARPGDERVRAMPAWLTTYFTLALWLWPGDDYDVVLAKLFDALTWAGLPPPGSSAAGTLPTKRSASVARDRLGPEPLAYLFRRLAGPANPPICRYGDLALRSLDTATVEVKAEAGFCSARIMVLADWCGALTAAAWAPGEVPLGELAARRLLRSLPDVDTAGALVCLGPVFDGLWPALVAAGAQLVAELPPGTCLPVRRALPDGPWWREYLAELEGCPVRVIDYLGDKPALVTSLTDPAQVRADGLLVIHRSRWPASELLGRLTGRTTATLRSGSALMADQEIWALLVAYQALARPLVDPAGSRLAERTETDR